MAKSYERSSSSFSRDAQQKVLPKKKTFPLAAVVRVAASIPYPKGSLMDDFNNAKMTSHHWCHSGLENHNKVQFGRSLTECCLRKTLIKKFKNI